MRLRRLQYGIAKPLAVLVMLVLAGVWIAEPRDASAEYGDVIINNYSDQAGMRPVVFPHWFHRIRFRCKVCHADLGFRFKAGWRGLASTSKTRAVRAYGVLKAK